MISLRASYALLALTSGLLTAALSTTDPMLLALGVASVLLAGQIYGQARRNQAAQERARR
jgi:hypothetical protein